jgi:hypothetical protein
MVRALLDGRKTQTRRVLSPQPFPPISGKYPPSDPFLCDDGVWRFMCGQVCYDHNDIRCPFGLVGDRLYVRETFYCDDWRFPHEAPPSELAKELYYRADGEVKDLFEDTSGPSPWKPSIHMPRWASRITLEVTGVRVERLDDMGETDAIFEGVEPIEDETQEDPWAQTDYLAAYRKLWNSLNAKRGYGWDVNPWVWVIEFNRVESAQVAA